MRKILLVILLLKILPCEAQNIPFAFWKSSGGTLDTVIMTTPSYSAISVSVTPLFIWTAVTNATSYVVEVSNNFTVGIVLYRDTVTTNSIDYTALHTLDVGTLYYWRVRARAPTYTESPNVVLPFKFTTTSPFLSTSDSLFARMGTLTTSRKYLIDSTIRMLKDSTVWDSLDVLWVTANKDTVTANQNWKSSSYTLVRRSIGSSVIPSFTADSGYKNYGNGYLTTSWIPSSSSVMFTKLRASYGFWGTTDTGGTNTLVLGSKTSATPSYIYFTPYGGTDIVGSINDNTTKTWTNTLSTNVGFFTITRTDSSNTAWYHNGVQKSTSSTSYAVNRPTHQIYLLAINIDDSPNYPSPLRMAVAYLGGKLSTTGVRKLYNCLNYYMTGRGTHP